MFISIRIVDMSTININGAQERWQDAGLEFVELKSNGQKSASAGHAQGEDSYEDDIAGGNGRVGFLSHKLPFCVCSARMYVFL
jgi:hypothetical protein